MGYGYGVGFIKATSDIPIKNLGDSGNLGAAGTFFRPLKILGTSTDYQVPSTKSFVFALERRVTKGINLNPIDIGYANDINGTGFVKLVTTDEIGLVSDNTEAYYVFIVPANKYPMLRIVSNSTTGTGYHFIFVGFEV
jgi:hypothetical protein